jgi:hypothetical protein
MNDKGTQFFELIKAELEKEKDIDDELTIIDYFRCQAENIDIICTESLRNVNDLLDEKDRDTLLTSLYFISKFRKTIERSIVAIKKES